MGARRKTKETSLRLRLTVDAGLAVYLRALAMSSVGIFGDERKTIIYALRSFLIDLTKPGSGFRDGMFPHLPPRLQKLWKQQDRSRMVAR